MQNDRARRAERLRFLLQYGMLAPLRGRAQPWSLYAKDDAIELWLEHSCSLPVLDPLHREIVIGCGVALTQVRLALRQLGAEEHVEVLPDPTRPALLARVHVDDAGGTSPEAHALFHALSRALETRTDVPRHDVPRETLSELQALAANEHAVLRWIEERSAGPILVDTPSADAGFGCDALDGLANIVAALHPFRRRSFHPSTREWLEESSFELRAPVVCVLATQGDTARDWIAGGQALGRLLVRARVDDLHPSFRDANAELDRLRARLRSSRANVAVPQIVFRLGFPERSEILRLEIPRYEALRA